MRCGLVAKKLGMSSLFDEVTCKRIPITLFYAGDCKVVGFKTVARDGYDSVVIGSGSVKSKRVARPQKVMYEKLGIAPSAKCVEFKGVTDLKIGDLVPVQVYSVGQFVDVSGVSVGKGFAGGMKRHGFGGLRASHGVSVSHRSHGSTGQCQDAGKVFKGKKMAGHMGCRLVTKQNLRVVYVNPDDGVIAVCGSVPGYSGSWVTVRDAVKMSNVH